ncbi:Protein glass [Gryllus bimaculatus]|nr:Protein glass [Gryllus bimaculatus]
MKQVYLWKEFRAKCMQTQKKLLREKEKQVGTEAGSILGGNIRKSKKLPLGDASHTDSGATAPSFVTANVKERHGVKIRKVPVTAVKRQLASKKSRSIIVKNNVTAPTPPHVVTGGGEQEESAPCKAAVETTAAMAEAKAAAGRDEGEAGAEAQAPGEAVSVCCGRRFRDATALQRHEETHHTEHRCPVCSKLFKNKFSLRSHAFVHAERRHFCCHVCGLLFRTASCLCNHVRSQHSGPRRAFECPHCSKLFGQRFHLALHMRSHTGERPFACGECPQRFASRCQLTRHERGRHRRDARFVCAHCDARFRYSSNYKGCSVCGKRFADCSNRKRHMAMHEAGPRPPRASRARKGRGSKRQDPEPYRQYRPPTTNSSSSSFAPSCIVRGGAGLAYHEAPTTPQSSASGDNAPAASRQLPSHRTAHHTSEMVTLLTTGDGGVQQVRTFQACAVAAGGALGGTGFGDRRPSLCPHPLPPPPRPPPPPLQPPTPTVPPPQLSLTKKAIVRMLNSQGHHHRLSTPRAHREEAS